MQTKKPLLYTGLKVKLKDPNQLQGALYSCYELNKYVFIREIIDETRVVVSDNPVGHSRAGIGIKDIIPIYEEDILYVLDQKMKNLESLQKEIKDIKTFINETCKNVNT